MMLNKFTRMLTVTMLIVLVLFLFVHNQTGEAKMLKGAGRGYFMFGGAFLDLDDLNSSLQDHGYPEMSDTFFALGGGGHAILNNKLILGAEGHGLITETETSGDFETSLMAGYGLFNVGYMLYAKGDFHLYPLLGLGGGAVNLRISEHEAPSFDEVLDNPRRSSNLIKGGFLVGVALGADYLFTLGEDENGRGGLVFGLRAGYLLTPFTLDWRLDDNKISGGPDAGITGPYIYFMIGGGGESKTTE